MKTAEDWNGNNFPFRVVAPFFFLWIWPFTIKPLSGDEVWWNLTALHYHYETQPIPNTVAWFFHQFPGIFHKASVGVMFAVELLVPFLIFFPRRLRILSFWIIPGFMFLIILTGNYTFFNWLTLLLCLLLLDDQCLPWWLRWKHRKTASDNTQVIAQ